MMTNLIFFITGAVAMALFGKIRNLLGQYLLMVQHKKIFTDVLEQIISGKTVFINRINNNVTLDMRIKTHGKVVLFYDMDQRILAISKDNNVILLSTPMSEIFPDLVDTICDTIETRWHKQIEDVVETNGVIVNREFLEETVRKNMESRGFPNVSFTINPDQTPFRQPQDDVQDDVQDIQETIDGILDKIHTSGMESLSPMEKEFLEKYGKG